MIRRALSMILPAVLTLGCGSEPGPGDRMETGARFCEPLLARVDSFLSSRAQDDYDPQRYGGMVVVGSVPDLAGMLPGDAGDVGSAQHQQFVNLMTLVSLDEDLEPVPYLARSWDLSEGGTELTFHLRDDVYWHDGEPTTAQDVAFTYRTVTNPESGFPNLAFFQAYPPGPEAVEVLDSLTVRFRFRPHTEPLEVWAGVAIIPEHLLGEVPTAELATHPFGGLCPVGNGPFVFVSRDPGQSWTFRANPAFPQELGGRPYLDRYVYRAIPDQTTLLAELLTGGVDMNVQMLANQVETVEAEPDLRVESFTYPSVFVIAWNTRRPHLSDARVRRAITQGINRRQLIQGVQGGDAVLLNSGLPPVHWAFDPALGDSLPFDPEAARQLLEDAGWTDRDGDGIRENSEDQPLSLELISNRNQERQQVAEIIRVQLQEIGVDLRLVLMEYGAYGSRLTDPERDYDGAIVTWETGLRIDERDLFHSEVSDGLWAFPGIEDPELDRYLDTLQFIPDREEAREVWRDYQLRIIALQPYTFLYSAYRRIGINRRVQDAVMDARGNWATIRQWWIRPEDRSGR